MDRREQIIQATLVLLATTPLHEVSTRRIAAEVGVSQPALFRHFRSRDAIVVATIDRVRKDLGAVAAPILAAERPPLDALDVLVAGVLGWAAANPGMPRLLLQDIGSGDDSPFRAGLSQVVSMQEGLLATLIRAARSRGELPTTLDPDGSARLLLAMIQGTLFREQLTRTVLAGEGRGLYAAWLASARAGQPEGGVAPAPVQIRGEGVVSIDVRPVLAGGVDPLEAILEALDRVAGDGVLQITAPFRPNPLIALLGTRGFRVDVRGHTGGLWVVEAVNAGAGAVQDLRGLEAPEPMEAVLRASAALEPGQAALFRTPQVPRLLMPMLEQRGLVFSFAEEPDGAALLYVGRPR